MSSPSAISARFSQVKDAGRMAFMPFVTAGDPNLETTIALVRELATQGVDLIEVGFPYSDPIADGPTIQASYTRALENGVQVNAILDAFRTLSAETEDLPPLVAMVSFAIVFRHGVAEFAKRCAESGYSGLIIPDLPGDEAEETAGIVRSTGLDLIELMAPTTPPDRADRILKSCSGFVYCISVAGTTGVREALPEELAEQLNWLRSKTDLPLAVGFGISRPDQVDALRGVADGVIVGSAIVRLLEEEPATAVSRAGEFAASMVEAVAASK